MRVLFWEWNAFMQKGMENALKKLKISYDVFYRLPKDWEQDAEFEKHFAAELGKVDYDAVLSVNFCPIVSDTCQKKGVKYVAWVYDSPLHIRSIQSFHNSCNRIYVFDRGQALRYQAQGYDNVYHMPLAADEMVWQAVGRPEYECDVAFVGQMYHSDYNYLLGPLDSYYRGRLDGYLMAQENIYGAYLLDELLTESLLCELNKFYDKASGGTASVTKAELEYACACEVTSRERFKALSLLAGRCRVNLYSGDEAGIPKVHKMNYVDYYTQMPAVFAQAKINLNISLKTIRTGIPLRVLDILSCGGFLITNYQEELFEYFEPGNDIVVYEDMKDLVYKVQYYLDREEERKRIARNGQQKVRELFGFEDRLKSMLMEEGKSL